MKKIFLFLFLLSTCVIYAQEAGKILYSEDVCSTSLENETQDISFRLDDGLLSIKGRIIANCCGAHFLAYEVYEDSIFLSRTDDGELCDCYCLYDIDIKLENCLSNFYKVKLDDYNNNPGIEVEVGLRQSTSNISIAESIKYYSNPAKKEIIIELLGSDFDSLVLYDIFGKIVKRIDIVNNDKLLIDTENLVRGIYIIHLLKKNEITFLKKNNHPIIFQL